MKTYLDMLDEVAQADVAGLRKAEESYKDSWKKRGGVGAFMMLARKWDRIENQVQYGALYRLDDVVTRCVEPWDIFAHAEGDTRPEGIIDDIRDLRRYLMLVEAEVLARKANAASTV